MRRHAWLCVAFLMCMGCRGTAGSVGQPPELFLNPDVLEKTYQVGDTITITVLASDERAGLRFGFEPITDNPLSTVSSAEFITTSEQATFVWTPDTADVTRAGAPVRLIFSATDLDANTTERELKVSIVPGNGQPRFTSPSSELHRDCCDREFVTEVQVRDDDSQEVTLTMQSGPQGARFDQIDAKRGRLRWTPGEIERAQRLHSAVFVADDGENPPVTQEFSILIPPAVDPNDIEALGQMPVCAAVGSMEHEPLGHQREPFTTLPVSARVVGGYDEVFVLPGWRDPGQLMAVTENFEEPIPMVRGDGDVWMAEMPNFAAALGANLHQFYEICAYDSSGASPVLCLPDQVGVSYGFNVYVDEMKRCLNDPVDAGEFGFGDNFAEDAGKDLELNDEWFPKYMCPEDEDFHAVFVRPGQRIKVLVAYPSGTSSPSIELLDVDQDDVTDRLQVTECGLGYVYAELSEPLAGTPQTYYIKVAGDAEAAYYINSFELEAGRGCSDQVLEPNDSETDASILPPNRRQDQYELCPDERDVDVHAIELEVGQKIDLRADYDRGAVEFGVAIYKPSNIENITKVMNGLLADEKGSFDDQGVSLTYEATECGTHYVQVFSTQGSGAYALENAISEGSCQDTDMYTCNHRRETAGRNVLFSLADPFTLCPRSSDWYEIRGPGVPVTYFLTMVEGDIGDVSLALTDGDGRMVASGESAMKDGAPALKLTYDYPDNDFYYMHVNSTFLATSRVTYDIKLEDTGGF